MSDDLPRGMASDLTAFERSDDEFERVHGREARARWAAIGAQRAGTLAELQLEVIERDGVDCAGWNALAWEIQRRIELLEQARAELRRNGGGQ